MVKIDVLMKYIVRNIVIKATTSGHIYINDALKTLGHGSYDPGRFSAIITRYQNPKVTINIFSTGLMIIMGSKTIHNALYVLHHLKKTLGVEFVDVEVTNILVTIDIGTPLDVQKIYDDNRETCMFDQNLFPSCVYKVRNSSKTISIFESGKMTVYGCKNVKEIEETIKILMDEVITPNLDNYRLTEERPKKKRNIDHKCD